MQKSSLALKSALALTLLLAAVAGWGVPLGRDFARPANGTQQGSEWKWLTGGNLKAVKFIGQKGWIIGDDGNQGIILHTTDGGDTWAIQPHNTGRHYFRGLSFVDSANGWIVGGDPGGSGEPSFIMRTRDGANSWTFDSCPTRFILNGVCFVDTNHGWLTNGSDSVFKTNDGARTWIGAHVSNSYFGIVFKDTLRGWAAGGGYIGKTTDGGITWKDTLQYGGSGTASLIDMADSGNGWVAGALPEAYHTTDGWQSWTVQSIPTGGLVYGLTVIDANTSIVVGGSTTARSMIAKTTNRGTTWSVDSGLTQNFILQGTQGFPTQIAWTVGQGGSILKTTNIGMTWRVYLNVDISTRTSLNVTFPNSQSGWSVGTYGAIAHTSNGGTVWQLQNSGTQAFLWGVDFPSLQSGWACGESGTILATANGGANWGPQTSNTTYPLFSIDFADDLYGVAVGGYYGPPEPPIGEEHGSMGAREQGGTAVQNAKFKMQSANWMTNGEITLLRSSQPFRYGTPRNDAFWMDDTLKPWGTGLDFWKWPWNPQITQNPQTPYRAIIRTTNGGALWIAQNTSGNVPLYGVSFVTPNEGWACGDPQGGMGVILHTTDSGATWTGQSSNVNQGLYWIQFKNSFTGWCVGNNGTALWTTDGGNTWNQGNTGTTLQFLSCAFYDTQNGFACGGNGTLFKTTDGGRNWQSDTSKTYANLMAVFALDSLHAWSVGSYGMVLGWREAGMSGVEQRGPDKDRDFASLNRIKAWPNPFVSFVRVPGYEKERFALYDITGRRVGTYKGDRIGADASAGVYFLMVEGKEGGPVRIVKVR